ncbi:hypothetical protein H0H93_008042 [Arthromyces matolae]|nr:hypothetical protein H0H93_008042 [Arthromyces matolae]
MNIRAFVAFACTTCIISMLPMLSTAAPLSDINPSLPRSLPNIELHSFEPRDTQLYPRLLRFVRSLGFRVFPTKEDLMSRTTLESPQLKDWVDAVNEALNVSSWEEIEERFKALSRYFADRSVNFKWRLTHQAEDVQYFVNFVVVAQRWMNLVAVRTREKGHLEAMIQYLTIMKSLCANKELGKYKELREFLVNSRMAEKKLIQAEFAKHSSMMVDFSHIDMNNLLEDHILDSDMSEDLHGMNSKFPSLDPES